MIPLPGPISDRLRVLYGPDVADWPACRMPDEICDMPPQLYRGIDLDPHGRGTVGAHDDDRQREPAAAGVSPA